MMDRNQRNTKSTNNMRPHQIKILLWLVTLFTFLTLYKVAIKFAEPKLLPILHVKMEASYNFVNQASLKKRISSHVKGFFSTNMAALKNDILAEPYVDNVIIKRIWPDTLSIVFTEMIFVARWGEGAGVNSKGNVIAIKLDSKKPLPVFIGPDESFSQKILEQYNLLSAMLRPYNLAIAEVNMNQRHSWQVTLDNGIKILLGRKDISDHLASFVSIYPKLKKRHGDNIESIDLRHSNGVSVHLIDAAKPNA